MRMVVVERIRSIFIFVVRIQQERWQFVSRAKRITKIESQQVGTGKIE
jgi:hypothetical protein